MTVSEVDMRKRRRVILIVVTAILIVSIAGFIFVYNHNKTSGTYTGRVKTFGSRTYSDIGITSSTTGYLTFSDKLPVKSFISSSLT